MKIILVLLAVFFLSTKTKSAENNKAHFTLQISVLLEGLFCSESFLLQQATMLENGELKPAYDHGISDVITIELHQVVDYSQHEWGDYVSYRGNHYLSVNGLSEVVIPFSKDLMSGHEYWLCISHRNHMDVVYNTPITLSINGFYHCNLITGENGENNDISFGQNQKNLGAFTIDDTENTFWGLYAGDVNNDGIINLTDFAIIANSLIIFKRGYHSEDIDGDGIVSIIDRTMAYRNVGAVINFIHPINNN